MIRTRLFTIAFLALCLVFTLIACDRNIDDTPIPPDGGPAIALVSPTNNNFLDTVGGVVTATFRLDDNEALKVFRVIGTVFDQRDSVVGSDFIVSEEIISGQHILKVYSYTVPILPVYFKVRLTCYAIDTKGTFASAIIWVNVIPKPGDPPVFLIESYDGDKLFSQRSLSNKHYFDFYARNYINNTLDKDIEEISQITQSGFKRRLHSPNNIALGNDSIFVFTDASRFNYNLATYQTIYEAFYSDPAPYDTTPVVNIDDIIIVRLTNLPHFAVMRVTDVADPPGDAGDFIEFDYLVTY
jgi:hypothetical protein